MDWPRQSPDLSPIEQLWDELERRLAGRKAKNIAEKFVQLEEEWKKIPQTTIDALVDPMPRRCRALICVRIFQLTAQFSYFALFFNNIFNEIYWKGEYQRFGRLMIPEKKTGAARDDFFQRAKELE
ncbi:hypothetical protein ANCCEY_05464 [Ancylostoma ceylanicum]|uniref:Tc1-like transposase DDE domain-containing protein n=1 Tax=Ancylostoma ceylanicum TaxID=53326 RepID=A0A0D6LW92_9BILA|nr:hypothetical protein ANCCEY_05464 [Ancylostoma ceylanicum]